MVPFSVRRYPRNTGTPVQRARLLTSALDFTFSFMYTVLGVVILSRRPSGCCQQITVD